MHFHNCIELGFAREGKGIFYVGKSEVPFEAPCLVIAPPNVPHGHTVQAGEECSWNWIYVDPQAMLSNLSPRLINMISEYQRDVGGEECVLSEADHPEILMILKAIISEMEQTQVHYHHIVRELFGTLFLLLLRSYSGKTKNNLYVNSQLGCIAPAVAYIAENYMEEISVEKLSYLCHVSTSHFGGCSSRCWAGRRWLYSDCADRPACVLLYNATIPLRTLVCRWGIRLVQLQPSVPAHSRYFAQPMAAEDTKRGKSHRDGVL